MEAADSIDQNLRYCFPKSRSKRFEEALGLARRLPGYSVVEEVHWLEFPFGCEPPHQFKELERISRDWKGSGFFLGGNEVTRETWWEAASPFGKRVKANVTEGWIDRRLWMDWGEPENLVVGESYRQPGLRGLVEVAPSVTALCPVSVSFVRDFGNSYDPHAVKASIGSVHVGYLPAERAAVVAPVMDRFRIRQMDVAGIISGSDNLGVHVWPGRLLSDGVGIGDPTRPVLARFYDDPPKVFQEYLERKAGPPANIDKALASCITAFVVMFVFAALLMAVAMVAAG